MVMVMKLVLKFSGNFSPKILNKIHIEKFQCSF